ncbi:hypothetical protein NHQ30_002788 [Ciborinia camelliae]|nr:hypothetical protein NHQ30_002788 [Ciborinia camelliae]
MDTYKQSASNADLYLNTSVELHPGLEVGTDPSYQKWSGSRQEPYAGTEPKETASPERKQISGLSVNTFWALVVLLCIIIAGGIGGGIGAGLAAQRSNCKSSVVSASSGADISAITVSSTIMPSTTITNSSPSTTSSLLTIDGSGSDSSSTTSSITSSTTSTPSVSPAPFSHCSDQFSTFNNSLIQPLSSEGSTITLSGTAQKFRVACYTNYPSGAQYGNPNIHDIMKIYMPDLKRCIMACAKYNAGYATNLQAGIDVGGGLCRAVSMVVQDGEFCYLKNGTGVNNTAVSGGNAVRKDSALLQ